MGCIRTVRVQLGYLALMAACATQVFPSLEAFVVTPLFARVMSGTFAVTSFFTICLFSMIGAKPLVFTGGILFASGFVAEFYGEEDNEDALRILGGVLAGLGSGVMQATCFIAIVWYPLPLSRGWAAGTYNIMFGITESLLCGVSALTELTGGEDIAPELFITYCVCICLFTCSELFLLDPPGRVLRSDGSVVPFKAAKLSTRLVVHCFTTLLRDWFFLFTFLGKGMLLHFVTLFYARVVERRAVYVVYAAGSLGLAFGGIVAASVTSHCGNPRKRAYIMAPLIVALCVACAVGAMATMPDETCDSHDKDSDCFLGFKDVDMWLHCAEVFTFGTTAAVSSTYDLWALSYIATDNQVVLRGYMGSHMAAMKAAGLFIGSFAYNVLKPSTTANISTGGIALGALLSPLMWKKLPKVNERKRVDLEVTMTVASRSSRDSDDV